MAVLGENGAGKTTLLRISPTAARPTSGRLEIMAATPSGAKAFCRRRIGFVAHAPGLYPALSAVENLDFFCTLHGVSPCPVAEVLSVVGLSEVARRPAGQLSARHASSGWRSPARSFHEPKLLVWRTGCQPRFRRKLTC